MVQRALSVDPEVACYRPVPICARILMWSGPAVEQHVPLRAVTAGSGHEEVVGGGLYLHHVRLCCHARSDMDMLAAPPHDLYYASRMQGVRSGGCTHAAASSWHVLRPPCLGNKDAGDIYKGHSMTLHTDANKIAYQLRSVCLNGTDWSLRYSMPYL